MEQEPYEFWTRPARPEPKGKATHGKFRKHAFLASKKTSFEHGYPLQEWGVRLALQTYLRILSVDEVWEKTWAIKKR
jgi:hypothetical protein